MNTIPDQPVSVIIFGASGDLTHRKLIPALYNLYRKHRLPEGTQIIGYAINQWDDNTFRDSLRETTQKFSAETFTPDLWDAFAQKLFFVSGNFTAPGDYARLSQRLAELEPSARGRIYYLATPPVFFIQIVQQLHQAQMLDESHGWRRVVIEKPFGTNLTSARVLNRELHEVLQEDQIFRIDHYLGKETVQNILVFRFGNTIFEPVWNHQYIDHVQITVAEQVGVEHRAGYYETAGILRDMFQNHLMQLLALIALEPPDSFRDEDLHARKLQLLKSVRPILPELIAQETVRGQYHGYRQEPGVASDSTTATFAVIRLFVDNHRWQGVPFYLRSGKGLAEKVTEIIIQFKCPPFAVFPMAKSEEITPDILSFCIQPDEGVYLRFEAKVPDTEADTRSVEMEFRYATTFLPPSIPDAYERLILEVIQGDHTLFTRDNQVEQAWKIIDPIIDAWENKAIPPLETYHLGSWGPPSADQLIEGNERRWHIACGKNQDI